MFFKKRISIHEACKSYIDLIDQSSPGITANIKNTIAKVSGREKISWPSNDEFNAHLSGFYVSVAVCSQAVTIFGADFASKIIKDISTQYTLAYESEKNDDLKEKMYRKIDIVANCYTSFYLKQIQSGNESAFLDLIELFYRSIFAECNPDESNWALERFFILFPFIQNILIASDVSPFWKSIKENYAVS